jgi:hypothetical protein
MATELFIIHGGKMKKYVNYLDNQHERKRLEAGGCHHIKIAKGEVISYINKSGVLIEKKVENGTK